MQFLATVLKGLIAGNLKTTVEFTQKQVICAVFIGVALFFAFVSLSIAIFIVLLHYLSPLWIALLFCAFWLIVALGAYIALKVITARKHQEQKKQMEEQKTNLMIASALTLLPALQKNKLWIAALPVLGVAALYLFGSDKDKEE